MHNKRVKIVAVLTDEFDSSADDSNAAALSVGAFRRERRMRRISTLSPTRSRNISTL
jgi:hypothetical protein